ncbi:hypothetical protein [Pandoraea apista]|uniref:Uncharacterized protein n=1 Tax=Pandoraea apista TaxID=93218 RepID=A0A5E5P1T0_9BURK|nr:hypothetical protein [Pandoraea apista]OXS89587.1 hypothetical protein B7H01_20080 [Pandoraea apista]VVG70656.1 hypothetical protein PAP18089_01620 [Pandoraea apista]
MSPYDPRPEGLNTDPAPPSVVQTLMLHQMNSALCDFAKRWTLDGDYLRCRSCARPVIASRADMPFSHAHGCKAAKTAEAYPWREFVRLLGPLISSTGEVNT